MSWRVLGLLLLLVALFSAPAEAGRHRKPARKPAASDPLTDPTRVCVTAAQYKRMSKFAIKAGCFLPQGPSDFCAIPACVGHIEAGDFDGDGVMDRAFTIRLSEKTDAPAPEEYWGVFASVSSYKVVLRVGVKMRSTSPEPAFLQTGTHDSSGNTFAGWVITVSDKENLETFSFDKSKRAFLPAETQGHDADGNPGYGYPGLGLSFVFGTNSTFVGGIEPSGITYSPWIGYNYGFRLDGYLTRFLSLETGITWVSQSYKNVINTTATSGGVTVPIQGTITTSFSFTQYPVQLKFWPVPAFFFGGGIVYTTSPGSVGCSGDGTLTCSPTTIDYSKTGFKTSYVDWVASLGFKQRMGSSSFWLFGEFNLMGTPNFVQNATSAGTSSESFVIFQSYGGVRYGFFAD